MFGHNQQCGMHCMYIILKYLGIPNYYFKGKCISLVLSAEGLGNSPKPSRSTKLFSNLIAAISHTKSFSTPYRELSV
jgi:hypothetical protein